MQQTFYQRAIITGASSGFGEEFACQLATTVDELVLIARSQDKLKAVAERVRQIHPLIQVSIFAGDLTDPNFLIPLIDSLLALPAASTLLVNNAGMGDYGDVASADWNKLDTMLVLNVFSLTKLTHALLEPLCRFGGGIINVSSLASALPIPDFAVYAASKSYVLSFSEALRLELKDEKVNVLAVCPGPVATGFGAVARRTQEPSEPMWWQDLLETTTDCVVRESLQAMAAGKARVYPGSRVKWAARLLSLVPAPLIRFIMSYRPRRVDSPVQLAEDLDDVPSPASEKEDEN
jgi:short-subunit dehydrogenase